MFRNTLPFSVPITKTLSLCTATQATSVFSLESAEHMESKADTRLLMSSSLRAKVEFQRSDPQPLVGMSQCFPSKAMVTLQDPQALRAPRPGPGGQDSVDPVASGC